MLFDIEKEDKKELYIRMYMDLAYRVADMSHCTRRKVGSILVKGDGIISHGWNGMPTGWENGCEDDTNTTKREVLHAESNLLMKLSRSTESGEGSSLLVTTSPCIDCAKLILQAGVIEVFYADEYRNMDGVDFLIKSGINVYRITPDEIIRKTL